MSEKIFKMADDRWYNPNTGQIGEDPVAISSPSTDKMQVGSNPYAFDRTGKTPASESLPVNMLYKDKAGDTIDLNKMTTTRGEELQTWIKEQGLTSANAAPQTDAEKTASFAPPIYGAATAAGGMSSAYGPARSYPPEDPYTAKRKKDEATLAVSVDSQKLNELTGSQNPFSTDQAKEYARLTGDPNYQKFIGGVGGQTNPLYIGANNWESLKSQYTPYQLEKAIVRTSEGVYWNPSVNIAEVPRVDPGDAINNFAKDISNVIRSGTDETTILEPRKIDLSEPQSAADIFTSQIDTPELNAVKNEMIEAQARIDEYDQQLEELRGDIIKEVAGEAPESYINALAAVRGNSIMKLRRSAERDYATASANYKSAMDMASERAKWMITDENNRYDRAFNMLKLQESQAQNKQQMDIAYLNAMLNLPAGHSYEFSDGTIVKGIKENNNVSTGTLTEKDFVYYYAIDKVTGNLIYKTQIGTNPKTETPATWTDMLNETMSYNALLALDKGLASGDYVAVPNKEGTEPVYVNVAGWLKDNPKQDSFSVNKFWRDSNAWMYILDMNTGTVPAEHFKK